MEAGVLRSILVLTGKEVDKFIGRTGYKTIESSQHVARSFSGKKKKERRKKE